MKRFTIYKFRTLEDSKTSELSLGHRSYSRLGRVLRKFSLDELPQIYNVLIGEMSFVGPRALPVEYDSKYNDFQRYRFHCKPGMTGWAQVNGRNTISWDEKFQYDHWYVDNISFYVDLKIILLTFFKLFQQEGTKEMPVFTGSELN